MKQTRALQLFHNQLKKRMVTHAYLISGKSDTSDFAMYMAQSLLCKEEIIGACQKCATCERVATYNHPDYRVLGREDATIKKDEITSLKEYFSQTSLEDSPRKVYVIEDVDTASISALNSILKFLEEPDSDITAILTTSNPNRVLETIQSRCMMIQLESQDQKILYEKALQEGVAQDDAHILSNLVNSVDDLKIMSESETYIQAKDIAMDMLIALNDNKIHQAIINVQQEGIKNKKLEKDGLALFLDVLVLAMSSGNNEMFEDKISNISLDTMMHYKKIFIAIKDRMRPGINTNLLLDQLAFEIVEYHRRRSL